MDRKERGVAGYNKSKRSMELCRERQRKESISRYNDLKPSCESCGLLLPYEKRDQRFCNRSCSATFNNKKLGKRQRKDTKQQLICYCGKNTTGYNTYCSEDCLRTARKSKTIAAVLAGKAGPEVCKNYLREVVGNKCSICSLPPLWNSQLLVLQLDHKDGNSDNSSPENIRLLCPNCHTQTETFGNAGKGSRYKKITKRNKWLQEYKAPIV